MFWPVGGLVGFDIRYFKKDRIEGYKTIKKKLHIAAMNSTTKQDCVGELDT